LEIIKALTGLLNSEASMVFLTPFEISCLFLLFIILICHKQLLPFGLKTAASILVFGGLLLCYSLIPGDTFVLTVLNVGHGDALVLKNKGKTFLVDGGGSYSDHFDIGERLVAPALGWMGIKRLNAVILTHSHPDHYKGLVYILSHFQVQEFWSAMRMENLPEIIRKPLERKNIPIILFPEGWTILQQNSTETFSVFVPKQNNPIINDRSLVLYIRKGDNSLLLTGDLERPGVQNLICSSIHKNASLLKLPHHGSRHSSPGLLVDYYRPKIVFATSPEPPLEKSFLTSSSGMPEVQSLSLNNHGSASSLRFVATRRGWEVRYWQRGLFR
jgi:competence protein ComEC